MGRFQRSNRFTPACRQANACRLCTGLLSRKVRPMFFNLLPRWCYRASKSTQRGHLARRSFRPQLEWLEDRVVPSTFNVTTHADVVNATDGKLSLREAISRA